MIVRINLLPKANKFACDFVTRVKYYRAFTRSSSNANHTIGERDIYNKTIKKRVINLYFDVSTCCLVKIFFYYSLYVFNWITSEFL